jgi:two-component system, cell cycle response regulator CpdR
MSSNSSSPIHTQRVEPQRCAQARRTTILVVEDEESVREFVRLVLENAGYAVVAAHDGDHGFNEFAADPDRFSLVLTDVVMPNRTGPDLVEVIRRIRPDIPVIFMSAYTGGSSASPTEMPPSATLLEKPFGLEQLLHAANQAISQNAPRG